MFLKNFFMTSSYGQHAGAFALFIIFVTVEILFNRLKNKKRKEFESKKKTIESLDEIEDLSIEHYRQLQHIDVIRFVVIIIGIISILGVYNIQAFNIIAVATGAFIIALKDSFTSLVAYFFILSNFKLGDDIRINNFLGEIVRVKPLYTAIAGKDESGEYNSRLHNIPNFMFFSQIVDQQQLKSDDYTRVSLQVLYKKEHFSGDFEDFIGHMEKYLDELLPKRAMTKVGYFRGYAGVRYKMNFDYSDGGDVLIKISFIARSFRAQELKESIIRYVESLKIHSA